MEYADFITIKRKKVIESGFEPEKLNSHFFDFQEYITKRALKAGRFAIFADCGLGKTIMQLEWAHQILLKTGKPVLILAPLVVSGQTIREGAKFGIEVELVKLEVKTTPAIYITNYEQLDNWEYPFM